MNNLLNRIYLLFFVAILSCTMAFGQTANELLKKVDNTLFAVKDKTVNVKMVLLNQKTKKEKVKEAVLMQKGPDRKLFRYTYPESDAGIATLSLPNNEIYLYLPMFKKPKKITNIAESNTFNKSDFSIEDMAAQGYSEKYSGKILPSEDNLYVIELNEKDEKSSKGKQIIYVHKTYFYLERIKYFDKKDQHQKTALYKQKKVNGLWIAEQVSMEDHKKNHKTTLSMTNFKINQGLSDDEFTLEKLVPAQ